MTVPRLPAAMSGRLPPAMQLAMTLLALPFILLGVLGMHLWAWLAAWWTPPPSSPPTGPG